MNTLEYKNFIGTVNFSEEDDVFYGKLVGINALVTFEGQTVAGLKKAFKEAVSDYIKYCKTKGIKAQKTYTGVLNVRLTPEMHRNAAITATKRGTTLNSLIKQAVEKELKASLV
jgi:predicted HicB family RNase H-like nuclease